MYKLVLWQIRKIFGDGGKEEANGHSNLENTPYGISITQVQLLQANQENKHTEPIQCGFKELKIIIKVLYFVLKYVIVFSI